MSKFIDISGQRFGRLTVIGVGGRNKHGQIIWNCACDCGNKCTALACQFKTGTKNSCKCLQKELARKRFTKHGHIGNRNPSKEYRTLVGIKARCYNPNRIKYPDYGGRGIVVCDRWLESFENFFEDMGKAPSPKHSIERLDVNGNYEPSNCVWATNKEQGANRRNNVRFTLFGVTKIASEWCKEFNQNSTTVRSRLRRGMSPAEALITGA